VGTDVVTARDVGQDLHLLPDRLGQGLGHPHPVMAEVEVAAPDGGQQVAGDPLLEGRAASMSERMISWYRPTSLITPTHGFPRP
jgi:hypothetical protein